MPDILQHLIAADAFIEFGRVDAILGGQMYRVSLHGRQVDIQSAAGEDLQTGAAVIINRAGGHRWIIGTPRQLKSNTPNEEIVIDG